MIVEKKVYKYEGCVMLFKHVIKEKWIAYTRAPSEKKARSNLIFRFKKENGYMPTVKIYLPGKVTLFENDKIDDGEQLSFL